MKREIYLSVHHHADHSKLQMPLFVNLPPSSDKVSKDRTKGKETDDPSYCQFLASARSLLDLPTPEKDIPTKIFGFKDRNRKQPPLSMSLPSVD